LGGFDLHSGGGIANPGGPQSRLPTQVADAMVNLQAAIDAMGLGNQVTTFTASDFSRTLQANTSGPDR
jgi:uncharacterized protein (DUF1501 family)